MAMCICVFCGEFRTPWTWIEEKQGHACRECGEKREGKMSTDIRQETGDQVYGGQPVLVDGVLTSYSHEDGTFHPPLPEGDHTVSYPLGGKSAMETGPQKTVRLLREALKSLRVICRGENRRSPIGDIDLRSLISEIEDHADNGVLADDEYETAILWLSQQSGKPLRQVRRVLKSKLGIQKEK